MIRSPYACVRSNQICNVFAAVLLATWRYVYCFNEKDFINNKKGGTLLELLLMIC